MIIGIGGISRAGKTSLANWIMNYFGGTDIICLHQDDFPKYPNKKINNFTDWENPGCLDLIKLESTIHEKKVQYSHIIIEGIFAFYFNSLNLLYDKKIYLQLSKEEFINRRTKDTRWGEIPEWYYEHIWESYLIYGQIPANFDGIILNQEINYNLLISYLAL